MEITIEKYMERLTGILKRKKSLLEDILFLTEAQTAMIDADKIDELQMLLDQKQLKIDDINRLDDEFEVYFNRLKSSQRVSRLDELDVAGVPGAGELRRLTAEMLDIIKQISEAEKVNSKKSNDLLNNLGEELKKVNQGRRVNNAYTPAQPTTPSYFIDKKK